MKRVLVWLTVFTVIGGMPACSQTADPMKDRDQVEAEAKTMSKGALERAARACVDGIISRRKEYIRVEGEIREIPLEEQYGKKASGLKDRASRLSGEISSLNIHYDIYMHYYVDIHHGDYEKIKMPRD